MKLQRPNNQKLIRSASISAGGILFLLGLMFLFPDQDLTEIETAIVTAVGAWLINTMKESLK